VRLTSRAGKAHGSLRSNEIAWACKAFSAKLTAEPQAKTAILLGHLVTGCAKFIPEKSSRASAYLSTYQFPCGYGARRAFNDAISHFDYLIIYGLVVRRN
jgi:hypothetical protein